ncbi:MAG: methyltransferase domain-containing protein, partial [Planctomycetota bacterium]|nr:methyltransferase domain-containing protein [Planctomycetota bacterium]
VVGGIEARRRALVVGAVLAARPRVVVDIGCEDGWLAEAYVHGVERLILADLDPEVLARCALAADPRVTCVVTDATAPAALAAALAPHGADVIVSSALLEHLPDPLAALRALTPLLAPGGRVVIYLPADGPILLAKRILKTTRLGGLVRGLSLEPAPGHLHRFARADVARLLAAVPGTRVERLQFDPVCLGYLAVLRSA